jgi:hypothetical protein
MDNVPVIMAAIVGLVLTPASIPLIGSSRDASAPGQPA